ncbi:histidinol-phosphate aminotransferase [Pseudomonas aeruginosa]|nr:histidinol-phosphate aminotransferase [Pseudomonas aeruginosa]
MFSEHAFAVYPIATQVVGAEGRAVKARAWGHDLEAMLAAIDGQTRVVFVANPNNPTGTWFGADALERFLAQVPAEVLVVLDEAYIEYAEGDELPDGLDYLARHPNLLVSRTFSKAYGLASLRVGYALSSKAVADVLNRVRQPFNVNSLALAAACAALDDHDYLAQSRRLNDSGMAQLEDGFHALGLSWIPSEGQLHRRGSGSRCRSGLPGAAARRRDRASGGWLRDADLPARLHRAAGRERSFPPGAGQGAGA